MPPEVIHVLVFLVVGLFVIVPVTMLGLKQLSAQGGLELRDGEMRRAEMFAHTSDVIFRGITLVGSPRDGKLVLTSERLFYSQYDEKKVALELTPKEIESIEVDVRGIIKKEPVLKLTYATGSMRTPKTVSWTAPKKAFTKGGGLVLAMIDKENPHTVASFVAMLTEWHSGVIAADSSANKMRGADGKTVCTTIPLGHS